MATIAMKLKGLHSAEGAGESQRETHPVRRMIAGFFLVVISALVTVTSASAAHMRYSIWSRDVNGGAWFVNCSFGQWFTIKGITSTRLSIDW